jgi:hypothetical protein
MHRQRRTWNWTIANVTVFLMDCYAASLAAVCGTISRVCDRDLHSAKHDGPTLVIYVGKRSKAIVYQLAVAARSAWLVCQTSCTMMLQ